MSRVNSNKKTGRKLTASIITVALLSVCLCVTTFALIYSAVNVDDNLFQTGRIKINLNDGKPVITENDYLFEPGMTVEKKFFLENESTWDIYYKIYFDNIEGGLADVLDVTISNGGAVLFSGKASSLTADVAKASGDTLTPGERQEFTISFHFPENAGNAVQDMYFSFDLSADAVQTKNNPEMQFN